MQIHTAPHDTTLRHTTPHCMSHPPAESKRKLRPPHRRYGHHVEGVLVGIALTSAILDFDDCSTNNTHCHFTLEIDPMTRTPIAAPWVRPDGYGPTLLAFLEYVVQSGTLGCLMTS